MNKYSRSAQAEWRNERNDELTGKIEMVIICVTVLLCMIHWG